MCYEMEQLESNTLMKCISQDSLALRERWSSDTIQKSRRQRVPATDLADDLR